MDVSVIIPTYNRIDLIKFTLDSLNKARHRGILFEVIVIDDGSTDGTWAFIEENYAEVVLLKCQGKGGAAARNTGLATARGKYIMYLDSDDLVGENYFEQKVALMELYPELDACYGRYEYFKSDGAFNSANIIFKHKYPLIFSSDKAKEHLVNYLGGNFLPPNSIIWRKDFLVKCNGHDASLEINQDVDLFIRAIFNGLKIATLQDDTKVYIRSHSLDNRVGDPKNARRKWLQILELRKKIFKDLGKYGYDDVDCYRAISGYLFGYWKLLRHTEPAIAEEYLKFAKEIYWPIEIKGNAVYRMISKIFGPIQAVKMKYFLLKRD